MNNTFKIAVLLLFITVTFLGCRRDPIEEEICDETSGYTRDVKNWLLFQPGTYWIYEEENSGATDSVYVTFATDYGEPEGVEFWCETKNTLDTYMYTYFRNNFSIQSNCYPYLCPDTRCLVLLRSKGKSGDFVGETICFFYGHHVGDYSYGPSPTNNFTTLDAILDSLVVEGITFEDVVVMHETVNITEHEQETNFYFAKNIGIIRKELLDSNQVWNLICCNIIQ